MDGVYYIMNDEKICPLNTIEICTDECAWFMSNGVCAIKMIAQELKNIGKIKSK